MQNGVGIKLGFKDAYTSRFLMASNLNIDPIAIGC